MSWELNYASVSQVGRRTSNQDACFAEQLTSDIYLFAVADGMGGANGGETASAMVIETMKEVVLAEIGDLYEDPKHLRTCLEKVVKVSQERLEVAGDADENLRGMGTTLVALLIVEDNYCFCNIGDSRIYQHDHRGLRQLTTDHSLVQETLSKSDGVEVSEDFLRRHDHIITRVLNGGSDLADLSDVVSISGELQGKTNFLLCSDGLILDKINNPEYISESLQQEDSSPVEKCNYLSNYAYEKGSNDNITLIIVELESTHKGGETIEISNKSEDEVAEPLDKTTKIRLN